MKKQNKGYQQENSWACGENKSLEEVLKEVDEKYDERIKNAKLEYANIAKKTTLVGKDLFDYCLNSFLREVRFKHDFDAGTVELIPLEEIISMLEKWRREAKARKTYSYQKRIVNKDNQKFVYNSGNSYGYHSSVRIPSMKRSAATWKRFYELFPYYREHYDELNNYNGIKLKKVW
jgi:hypothetical protein